MSLTPEQVARVTPPIGSDWDIAKNRDHVTAGTAGKLTANDLTATITGREGLWVEYKMLAGFPVDHGVVADEAAMIGLHNWAADPLATASYHYVAPGDSCTRTDDPGYRWHCLAGHGLWIAQWERRPLAAAVSSAAGSAAWGGITGVLSGQTDLAGALGALAPLVSPALTGSPTAPTPSAGNNSSLIATTAFVAAAVSAGGGGGSTTTGDIKDGLMWWVVADGSNQPVDLHNGRSWAWQGTADGDTGKVARALKFSAAASSRVTNSIASDHVSATGFSFFGWMQFVGTPANGYLLGTTPYEAAAADRSLYIFGSPSESQVEFTFWYGNGSTSCSVTSSVIPTPNTVWFPVGGSYNPLTGEMIQVRPDGTFSGRDIRVADTGSSNGKVSPLPRLLSSGSMHFGNLPGTTDVSAKMLDSVAFWNRALTAAEFKTLYNDGSGIAYGSL